MQITKKYIASLEEANLDPKNEFNQAVIPQLEFEDNDTFWVEMLNRDADGNVTVNGKIRIGI